MRLALAATLSVLLGACSAPVQTSAPSVGEGGVTSATGSTSAQAAPSTSSVASAIPTQAASLHFAIASDGHLGDHKVKDTARDFDQLVARLNSANAGDAFDFVLLNGDLTDRGGVAVEGQARQRLAALEMPQFIVQGNHDRLSEDEWREVWGAPTNQVLNYGSYSLILVNTSNQQGDELCADKTWLGDALKSTAEQEAVLVVMHVTPSDWTKFGVDCPDVRKLLAAAGNVRAVFNGHDHDQVGSKESLGVRYFFDGHFGGHWGTKEKTYRDVQISGSGLTTRIITVSGKELSRTSFSW